MCKVALVLLKNIEVWMPPGSQTMVQRSTPALQKVEEQLTAEISGRLCMCSLLIASKQHSWKSQTLQSMNRWVYFPSIRLLKKYYVLTMCSVHVSRNTHAAVHVWRWEDNFMGFLSFSATWFSGAELRLPGLVSTPFTWGAILPSNFKYWLISKLEN